MSGFSENLIFLPNFEWQISHQTSKKIKPEYVLYIVHVDRIWQFFPRQ
jgi:hypothetical protein